MNVIINTAVPVAGAMLVTASVNRIVGTKPSADGVAAALQSATGHKMFAVAGSFNMIDDGPTRSIIQGYMVPTREAIPFVDGMEGFHSLSGSMYQDESENLWSLQKDAAGNYLVRANVIEDPAEMNELMQACCSAVPVGKDQAFFQAVASAEALNYELGDYVQYQSAGQMLFGFALASVDTDDGEEGLAVVNAANDTLDIIDARQVVGAAASDYNAPGLSIGELPEDLQAVASASGACNEALIEYYRKVYGFNPTYWGKLSKIINSHRFM